MVHGNTAAATNHEPTKNELVVLENLNPLEIFTPQGTEDILERITREAKSVIIDISTPEGRKNAASIAYKVAKSKTYLDDLGKDLVSGWKEQARVVDAERKRIRDTLDALKEEIRAPLTEWENKDKARIAAHEAALTELSHQVALDGDTSSAEIERRIARLIEIGKSRNWEEFALRARKLHEEAYDILVKKLEELAAAKREEAARQEKAEAEERAKREAEAAAQRERDRIEAERRAEAEATAKREADKQHRAKINREALQAMFSAISKQHTGNSDEIEKICKTIIESITKGQVPHIKISY